MDLVETVPGGGRVRFRVIGTTVYAQLPAALYKSSKPWVEITASTTDSVLSQYYALFLSSTQTGAGQTVRLLVSAAKNLELHGTENFDGDQVAHYSLSVDVASLPADFPNRADLVQIGLTSIPLDFYVDTHGRPRKVTEDLALAGQHITVEVLLTKIDVPVSIKAPPASRVEHA